MTVAIKIDSKRAFQKTVETTGGLIGNKIADEITSVSKFSSQNTLNTEEHEIKMAKERCLSPEKRQQITDE